MQIDDKSSFWVFNFYFFSLILFYWKFILKNMGMILAKNILNKQRILKRNFPGQLGGSVSWTCVLWFWLRSWTWLRSWYQGHGLEPHVGLCVGYGIGLGFSLSLSLFPHSSLPWYLSLSLSFPPSIKKKKMNFPSKHENTYMRQ